MAAVELRHPDSSHLLDDVKGLPDAPGVYIFHGDDADGTPLYVGKSVRIRTRVLSHLRNPQEASMLRQARQVRCRLTGGEVGALLLESQLIKQLQPRYNRRLRARSQLLAWCWQPASDGALATLRLVHAGETDFARAQALFGLYRSRKAARLQLAALADAHHLCLQAIGVEAGTAGRPCFRHAIERCAGACAGRVGAAAHAAAWRHALVGLELHAWPYAGAIGLIECDERVQRVHAIRDWCYLGSAATVSAARAL